MGKKWRNAPVYFVVAQIRHSPVLQMEAYAGQVQDRLRKIGYPDFREETSIAFSPVYALGEKAQPILPPIYPRLMFFNQDNTRGFILEQNAMSFHTTEYDTFQNFAEEFLKCAAIVHESVQLAHAERVGLRYLDAIISPNGEEGLRDYLAPGLLGLSGRLPKSVRVFHSISETRLQTKECAVLARTLIQAGRLGFPMDLQPTGVTLAERFSKINGIHAIIDIDASIEKKQPFVLPTIESELKTLRKGVGVAFDAIVTASAVQSWNR